MSTPTNGMRSILVSLGSSLSLIHGSDRILERYADSYNFLVLSATLLNVKAFARFLETLSAVTLFTSALSNRTSATLKQLLELLR